MIMTFDAPDNVTVCHYFEPAAGKIRDKGL